MKLRVPKGVFFLGMASLLNDTASEAIYPLLPLFLTTVVGSTVFFVGVIEGVAESVASLTKFFFGYYSDRLRRRESFILSGYSIAAFARPLMGVVSAPWQALLIRFTDRVGKGVRGAPRDAWLASMATPQTRGWIFGFHRSMDHAGAMIGPLLASGFLFLFPGQYRTLFLLTLIPGLLVLVFILAAMKTRTVPQGEVQQRAPIFEGGVISVLHSMPSVFKRYLVILLLFTLGNSSDAFLLLRLKSAGLADAWIPLLWSLFHVVKMLSSSWGGILSDRIGRKPAIVLGWIFYAVVYALIGWTNQLSVAVGLFLFYGVYYGLTEAPEKALVVDLVKPDRHGTAFGLYHLIIGIGAFPASLIFGFVYEVAGFQGAFMLGAGLAGLAAVLLWSLPVRRVQA